jgi:hypothetical protein
VRPKTLQYFKYAFCSPQLRQMVMNESDPHTSKMY